MSVPEDPWANEHHIQRVQSTLDFNLGQLAKEFNTRRMAEHAVKAGITDATELNPAQFNALMFLAQKDQKEDA